VLWDFGWDILLICQADQKRIELLCKESFRRFTFLQRWVVWAVYINQTVTLSKLILKRWLRLILKDCVKTIHYKHVSDKDYGTHRYQVGKILYNSWFLYRCERLLWGNVILFKKNLRLNAQWKDFWEKNKCCKVSTDT